MGYIIYCDANTPENQYEVTLKKKRKYSIIRDYFKDNGFFILILLQNTQKNVKIKMFYGF